VQHRCHAATAQEAPPRRISAIGVAERVAEERGERCGDCVGYSIRLKSRASASTALLFCTLGVLLRRLEADPELLGATHVFVDEVHERSVEVDLVLLALLDLRQRRPELRIILMSATLDGDLLSRYFDGAPSLKVPGRTFPVTALFLEDALEITKHTVDRFAEWAARVRSGNLRYTGRSSYSGGQSQTVELESSRIEDLSPHAVKERYFRYSGSVQSALAALDPDAVNYELAAQLVTHFLTQPVPEGPRGQKLPAILVFLSGAREIQKMRSALFSVSPNLAKEPMCSWILVLHSSLSPEEQRRVFEHPPPKARKVILATNIAEASITIDDVGVVVDTARVKELRYDSARRLASLEDVFVSRTSARQRRGRAGRVAPGTCVHLVTKYSHDRLLGDRPSAEVRRVPLEKLVLRIHASGLLLRGEAGTGGAESVCARLLEPPSSQAVRHSITDLIDLGALEHAGPNTERLTPLGVHLAALPLSARIGKLILLGSAFGLQVLDWSLTVAASLSVGSPLASAFERKYEAQRMHRDFAEALATGGLSCSDVLAALRAYNEWRQLGRGEGRAFCQKHFLKGSVLLDMSKTRDELWDHLAQAGLVPRSRPRHRTNYGGVPEAGRRGSLTDNELASVVGGLLCAALFPQVVSVLPREDSMLARMGGDTRCGPVDLLVYTGSTTSKSSRSAVNTSGFSAVLIHPGSVSAREKMFGSPYLVYHELARTAKDYVRDVTPVSPLALTLFAGALSCIARSEPTEDRSGDAVLAIGGWLRFRMDATLLRLLSAVRLHLDRRWRLLLRGAATRSSTSAQSSRQRGRWQPEVGRPSLPTELCSDGAFLQDLAKLLSLPVRES